MGFFLKIKEKQTAKRAEIFASYIRASINEMNTVDKYFEDHYLDRMKLQGIDLPKLDKQLEALPRYFEKYRQLFGQLVKISNGNSVFFTTPNEANVNLNDDKISSDIITTIPTLAEFVEISNIIIWGISDVLLNILSIEKNSWSGLKSKKQSEIDNCYDLYRKSFDIIVNEFWISFCNKNKGYDNQKYFDEFKAIAENDQLSKDAWFEIWFKKMKAVMKKYNYLNQFSDITAQIDDIAFSFNNPQWISISGQFRFSDHSSLSIKPSDYLKGEPIYTKAELIRIQNLYMTNLITGKYSEIKDPKYKK